MGNATSNKNNKPECIPFVNERQMLLGIFWNIAGGEQ